MCGGPAKSRPDASGAACRLSPAMAGWRKPWLCRWSQPLAMGPHGPPCIGRRSRRTRRLPPAFAVSFSPLRSRRCSPNALSRPRPRRCSRRRARSATCSAFLCCCCRCWPGSRSCAGRTWCGPGLAVFALALALTALAAELALRGLARWFQPPTDPAQARAAAGTLLADLPGWVARPHGAGSPLRKPFRSGFLPQLGAWLSPPRRRPRHRAHRAGLLGAERRRHPPGRQPRRLRAVRRPGGGARPRLAPDLAMAARPRFVR